MGVIPAIEELVAQYALELIRWICPRLRVSVTELRPLPPSKTPLPTLAMAHGP